MLTTSQKEKVHAVIRHLLKAADLKINDYTPAKELVDSLYDDDPTWYVVWGPDGLPIFQQPCRTVTEAVTKAALWVAGFAFQGYYTDSNMQRLSLEELASRLHVEEFHAPTACYKAYADYIEDNMEVIERGGWTPVCFDEFEESDECLDRLAKGAQS